MFYEDHEYVMSARLELPQRDPTGVCPHVAVLFWAALLLPG